MNGRRHAPIAVTACSLLITSGLAVSSSQGAAALAGHDEAQHAVSTAALAEARAERPLDAIGNGLGDQGRHSFADTYSNLYVDVPHRQVILYATNEARAKRLIEAAKRVHPTIDGSRVKIVHAAYTKKVLDATVEKIMKASAVRDVADLTVYSAAPAPDGSGILVTAKKSTIARIHTMLSEQTAVPVTVDVGKPVTASTWRWNDSPAFIGGDVLISNARKSGYVAQCTSSLAVYDTAGEGYLVTADHCFPKGSEVTGEGDPVGDFAYTPGHHIGYVEGSANGAIPAETSLYDAELVDVGYGADQYVNSDEADQPSGKWYPVTSSAYSYNGQSVCQDGARSYYDGHGVPCGIKVTNQDITYNLTWDDGSVHQVRGVEGTASSGWAVEQGDSGGLVFSVASSTTRQARGLVSAQNSPSDHATLYWTEAPDILNALGVSRENVT